MKATEHQIASFERISGRVLGWGVIGSAALLALGLALRLAGNALWSTYALDAGLILLMATPAARVLVSLVEYLYARDWFFVATTTAVILILLASVVSALFTLG